MPGIVGGYDGGGGGGMGAGMGGSAALSGGGGGGGVGRPSYPPYPMPPAEYQGGGAYDQYQTTGYTPGAPGGGAGGGAYQGNNFGIGGGGARGGGRTIPNFSPPPAAATPYYGNNGPRGSSGGNVPSGPYPPSFHAGDPGHNQGQGGSSGQGGGGALGGILQAPYNASASAQQRKYPPILGGAPDPAGDGRGAGGGMLLGGGGYTNMAGPGASGAGGRLPGGGRQHNVPALRAVALSIGSLGDVSPTPSFTSAISKPTTVVSGATGLTVGSALTGGSSLVTSYFGGGVGLVTPSTTGTVTSNSLGSPKDAPILPKRIIPDPSADNYDDDDNRSSSYHGIPIPGAHDSQTKKREWLLNMNATLESTPIGQLDPNSLPLSTIMNGWAKQKSSEGARMVEMWLDRVHSEYNAENPSVHPTARMYTMAVDAWAKSNGGAPAARRAEALLERMDRLYREGGGRHEALKPTTGIFNAVINVSSPAFVFIVLCCLPICLELSIMSLSLV